MSDYAAFERRCRDERVEAFVVLGSGLGALAERTEPMAALPFGATPGLPTSTVLGHKGRWTLGRWAGRVVLVSEGRLHYYEGHPWEMVQRPVRIAASLGARVALFTNAAGGIRDDLEPGTLMPIADHLVWNRPYPWRNPRPPSPYSDRLLRLMADAGHSTKPGTYAAVTGPSYETPAEIRALRWAGADAVGMSTCPEVEAAVAAGLECAAVSMITNRAAGLSAKKLSHEEVLATGRASASRLAALLEGLLARL
ncbi:MAG: purine-nucleoside phosphorylase [Gemmataceae bacterium]